MVQQPDFQFVFTQIKNILLKYEPRLVLQANERGYYSLAMPYVEKYGKEVFFGAVKINKNYVSFHLMPIYASPGLLKNLSPELRARMHGKSCFNFRNINPELVKELTLLTERGFVHFKEFSR